MIRNPVTFIGQAVLTGTSGSLLYVDGNLQLAQNNAQLFWDTTDVGLGIGVASSIGAGLGGKLRVRGTSAGTRVVTLENEGNTAGLGLDSYSSTAGHTTSFFGRKIRGTIAAPLRTNAGDVLISVGGSGAQAVDDVTTATLLGAFKGRTTYVANANWTASDQSTYLTFDRVLPATTAITEGMRLTAVGNLTLGNNPGEPSTTTNVGPMVIFAQGTANPAGLASNTAGLYAKDVAGTAELFGVDEAGNATQLTSHNFTLLTPDAAEPTPWTFYSEQSYLGLCVGADMAKVIRLLQTLFPAETLIARQPIPRRDWVDDQDLAVHRAMMAYEAWALSDDPDKSPAPPVPQLKQPPPWLRARLLAKGWLNTAKFNALTVELAAWKSVRGLV